MQNDMCGKSPWRRLLYSELKKLVLSGSVLDLGGARNSDYHNLFGGTHNVSVANNDKKTSPDFLFDFEEIFPLGDKSFDAVICLNTLEHIFNYEQAIREVKRILKPKRKIILAVPFLVQIHPSPEDHFRYSGDTLKIILEASGFDGISIVPIGRGPFTASAQMLYNILHIAPLRAFVFWTAIVLDWCVDRFTSLFKKDGHGRYGRDFYPLGFLVTAHTR